MRHLFALSILLMGLSSSSALANGWFYVPAQIAVQPYRVVAVAWNTSAFPALCQGRVVGRTAWGGVLFNTLPPVIVPPTLSVSVGVIAPANDPFVAGWAEIYCTH